mmetsp:Transcript_47014/g.73582  ORF Transcript_47014/g.73582 Transcript_47014/m.73582 type:complete len:112 (+) Transcript_47014:1447-1782(+)
MTGPGGSPECLMWGLEIRFATQRLPHYTQSPKYRFSCFLACTIGARDGEILGPSSLGRSVPPLLIPSVIPSYPPYPRRAQLQGIRARRHSSSDPPQEVRLRGFSTLHLWQQ